MRRDESPYDVWGAGHASTSLSAALGFAKARDLRGASDERVVAVIGDGALTGGMALEAMLNAAALDTDITVVGRYDADGAATATGSWSAAPGGVPVGTRSAVGGRNVLTLVFETERPARVDGYDDASGEAAGPVRSRCSSGPRPSGPGHHARAREILAELDDREEHAGPATYYTAEILAALGEPEVAIDRLYAAYRQRNPLMIFAGVMFGLDPLRSHRRFRDLLMRLGIHRHERAA